MGHQVTQRSQQVPPGSTYWGHKVHPLGQHFRANGITSYPPVTIFSCQWSSKLSHGVNKFPPGSTFSGLWGKSDPIRVNIFGPMVHQSNPLGSRSYPPESTFSSNGNTSHPTGSTFSGQWDSKLLYKGQQVTTWVNIFRPMPHQVTPLGQHFRANGVKVNTEGSRS